MSRHPFLVFMAVMALLVGGVISYIQSPSFAALVKSGLARYLPNDLGIEGDFSEFHVRLLPPGVSIVKPRLKLSGRNALGLPAGSSLVAERLDLAFRPVQMFSRNIRVHEVTIVGGNVNLLLGDALAPKKKKAAKAEFHWDELFQVHAEALSLIDTRIHLESVDPELSVDLMADHARLGQWSGEGGLGYELDFDLNQIRGALLKGVELPSTIDRLSLTAHLNARGLQMERFEIAVPGGQVSASGNIRGNVLDPKSSLAFTSKVALHGELGKILETAIRRKSDRPAGVRGDLDFIGKASGTLDRIMESLHVQGSLTGKDVNVAGWGADSLKAELGWQASPRGGELAVSKLLLSSREQERFGGFHPGGGGKLEVGAFKVDLGKLLSRQAGDAEPSPITLPLRLERAHLHWLGAGALKGVYPLDLRATGPITATFKPARSSRHPWSIEAKLNLDVEKFALDNQRLGQEKPLKNVLSVPKVRVEGEVALDPNALHLVDVTVATGEETSFQGTGKVDFKSGFDLFFSGPVDLSEVGTIAGNEIRGVGDLDVRVHGPNSGVILDFDPILKDAYYLHLRLGDLKGRVTWDDDRNKLIFSRIQVSRGRTTYDADGMIDLDKDKDTVDIGVRIPIGDIQDMSGIFDDLTKGIWWYPRELSGPVHGDIRVSGGIRLDKLSVSARVNGTDWQQWGERFSSVQMQGGYERGKYQITDLSAVKRTGRISGRISSDPDHVLDWGFKTEGLMVADLDHVAQLDVPMRGRLVIETSGQGKEGALRSSTLVRVEDYSVRGVKMPSSELSVRTEGGRADIKGMALGGQGTLEATYDFASGGRSSVRSELRHLDFTPVILLINPRLIQDRNLVGDISGALDLAFASGRMERANGSVSLTEYHLAKTGTRFELSHPVSFQVSDGSFDISDLSLRGPEGEATLSLHSSHSDLDGLITGEVDTSIVEFLTSAITGSEGTAVMDFSLGGALKEPKVFGKATFDGVALRASGVESPFENCSGALQLRQNVISVQNVQGDLAGGRVTADGSVLLFADRYPKVDVKASVSGSKLKVFPFQFVKVRGGIEVHGDTVPYQVDGEIKVESALSTEKVLSQNKGVALKSMQYTPPPSNTTSSDYPKFKLKIKVAADSGVMIRNDLFDAEAKGAFTIVNTIEAPRLLGSSELISGKMIFKDHFFQIQAATAVFDNPAVTNPTFNLTANTEINGTKVQMYASGKFDSLKVELSSSPVMPESEILSLLATGMTSSDAKKLSASDRTAMEQGEAASLLLNSLDFNRDMQSKTGLQIGLDESTAPQQAGASVFKPQTGADSLAQPKIVIRRKIGSRFELSYGQTISNSSNTNGRRVTGEYRFTPGFSLMGVWDSYLTIDAQERTSFGGDIKFQTRFK